jgi:hypothetical protein
MAGRVRRWLDGVGDPWEAFGDFLEVFRGVPRSSFTIIG